ncbi:MAG: AI-2E family transporter [Muribaculaceae bacterium]|nr:AI-2E family transporter [Muribaculaceae bacterium]
MLVRQRFDLDRTVRLVINCVIFLGVIWLINILRGVLLPFLVGCLIAYLFEPFVQFNRQLLRLKGRVIATFVTLFEVVFFLCAIVYLIYPIIARESTQMVAMLKAYSSARQSVAFVPESLQEFLRRNLDFELIASKLTREEWKRMIEETLSASWSVITGSISLLMSVFSWLIVVLYVVFIMIDYERIAAGFRRMVMPKYRRIIYKVAGDVKTSMNRYFRGQALIAFIVGVLFSIGFLIIKLPLAIIVGMFIGLLNMVPYLQLVSIIPVTLLCLICAVGGQASFWPMFWQAMAVYIVVQAIQDLILTPKIIGNAMSMNPAIIFLSLSVWGTLLGFIGLIIAIPLTTLLMAYYDEYLIAPRQRKEDRLNHRKS